LTSSAGHRDAHGGFCHENSPNGSEKRIALREVASVAWMSALIDAAGAGIAGSACRHPGGGLDIGKSLAVYCVRMTK
jgi:hypothetical protein